MTNLLKCCLIFNLLFLMYFTGNAQNCDTLNNNRINLGIYGGTATDLTYSAYSNRLFAAVSGPSSLLFTDDTGNTWQMAYPYDSLEYNCGKQGWGGGSKKVVTNNNGWVIALNEELEGKGELKSVTLNYNNGKPEDWFTLMDSYTMSSLGYGDVSPVTVALSDYYAYASFSHYLLMKDKNNKFTITDVLKKLNYPDSSQIVSIAPTNSPTGYPVYLAIDTSYTTNDESGIVAHVIFEYDGFVFKQIFIPTVNYIESLFTNPIGIKGDTLFMEVNKGLNYEGFIYKSFDGGQSWSTIAGKARRLEVDYSLYWKTAFPTSEGIILTLPGDRISSDLGNSFGTLTNNSDLASITMAEQPNSNSIITCMNSSEVVFRTNWFSGTFSANANDGYTNIQINKIARSAHKGTFYLATNSGIAYTTAYTDVNVLAYDKWHTTYGQFPVINCTGEYGAIAMDPNDSLHIIAGIKDYGQALGFSLSTTGYTGFSTITPAFTAADGRFGDIEFVTSKIVLCVTGANSKATLGTGEIWRSADGGSTWATVSPVGFSSGNCIAIAHSTTDTVIYVGTGASTFDPGKIWKSTDLGLNWTMVNTGPHDIADISITNLPILDIVADPRGKDTLYIASGQNNFYNTDSVIPQAFVKSIDGGLTYQYITLNGAREFLALEIDPNKPDSNLFVTNYREIFYYSPVLDTAILIHKGMPAETYSDIAMGSILVGTTTGFYSVGLEPIDDIILSSGKTIITNNNLSANIFPNPSNKLLNISIESKEKSKMEIYLFNMLGERLKNYSLNNDGNGKSLLTIDISNFPQGAYLLRINNCNQTITKKILISSH